MGWHVLMSWSMARRREACDHPANCPIQSVISAGGLSLSGMNLLRVEQLEEEDEAADNSSKERLDVHFCFCRTSS